MTNFVAGFSPRTLAYGASAAALAIVLQAGILAGVFVKQGEVGDQILASAPQTQSVGGSHVNIRFKADATFADITAFLDANKAVIVSSPSASSGFFKVRVAEKAMSEDQLRAVTRSLRDSPVVASQRRSSRKARRQGRPDLKFGTAELLSKGRPRRVGRTRPNQT